MFLLARLAGRLGRAKIRAARHRQITGSGPTILWVSILQARPSLLSRPASGVTEMTGARHAEAKADGLMYEHTTQMISKLG